LREVDGVLVQSERLDLLAWMLNLDVELVVAGVSMVVRVRGLPVLAQKLERSLFPLFVRYESSPMEIK
jgi:hypothetical protein